MPRHSSPASFSTIIDPVRPTNQAKDYHAAATCHHFESPASYPIFRKIKNKSKSQPKATGTPNAIRPLHIQYHVAWQLPAITRHTRALHPRLLSSCCVPVGHGSPPSHELPRILSLHPVSFARSILNMGRAKRLEPRRTLLAVSCYPKDGCSPQACFAGIIFRRIVRTPESRSWAMNEDGKRERFGAKKTSATSATECAEEGSEKSQ